MPSRYTSSHVIPDIINYTCESFHLFQHHFYICILGKIMSHNLNGVGSIS